MAKYTYSEVEYILRENTIAIAKSAETWKRFLEKSVQFYKYSFSDKLLITSIKPKATACANFDTWTKTLDKRVKYKADGIPLIGKDKKLHYVFDVADTTANVNLWRITENNKSLVSSALADRFNSKEKDMKTILTKAVDEEFNINSEKYLTEAKRLRNNGYTPKELTDDILIEKIKNVIVNSAKYAVLSRTNIPVPDNEIDFSDLKYFKNINSISFIGNSVDGISETILRQVEREVKNLNLIIDKQKEENREENRLKSFTRDEIETARNTNLVDFLFSRGINLKRVGNNEYTLLEHDSMRISPDKGFFLEQSKHRRKCR